MNKQTNRPDGQPTQEPVFVPKQENQVSLDLDESLDLIVQAQKEKKKLEDKISNLKAVAKTHLKARGVETYENEKGRKAQWYGSQRASYDKELMKELLSDEDFGRCVTVKASKSFKVT